jgi:hypothetical protein
MSSPARAVKVAKTPLSWLQQTPAIWLTPNRAKSLPGIFDMINPYREHKESAFAALVCVYRFAAKDSLPLLRRNNSFG